MSDRLRTLQEFVKCMERRREEENVDENLLKQLQRQSEMESVHQILPHMLNGGFNLGKFLLHKPRSNDEAAVTPLHMASMHGQLEMVKFLIEEQHSDPNKTDLNGHAPIHAAAAMGHLDIVKYLIDEQKCNPMSEDPSGRTPVHYACESGNFEMIKYLVEEHRTDPSRPDKVGISPLHIAAANGIMDIVRYLVDEKNVDPKSADIFGETPLHASTQYGQVDVVKYLVLEKHCDPLVQRKIDGCAPIFLAALRGCLELVQFFVNESNCDPNIMDKDGRTPLYAACQGGHLQVVKCLVDEYKVNPSHHSTRNNSTPLQFASRHGHYDIVRYLVLERHCDPSSCDKHCSTPIHDAAFGGHLKLVRFFVEEQKCNPLCKGEFGRTPLHYACHGGHLEVVKYLVEQHQVDVKAEDQNTTPLHLASSSNDVGLVKYLIANGCDPHYADSENGSTPLHIACFGGRLEIVKYLVSEQSCDPTAADHDGDTGLHCAALMGHLDIVKYLVEKRKCDPMYKGQRGSLPLHAAAQNGHLDIVKYFVETCRVNPHTCNDGGILPIDLAAGKGQMNCVQYLHNYQNTRPGGEQKSRSGTHVQVHSMHQLPLSEIGHSPFPTDFVTGIADECEDTLPNYQLDPNDLDFLMNLLHPIAHHWKSLGEKLRLPTKELETIETMPLLIPGGSTAFLREMLQRYLNFAPPSHTHPTLANLCDALRNPAIGEKQIAKGVEKKYQAYCAETRWEDDPELKPHIQTAEPTGVQLGAGAYGSVEQVKINGAMYAAKKFRVDSSMNPDEFTKKFATELHILLRLNHPNIVQYKAICFLTGSNMPALVMEQLQVNLHAYLLNASYANLPLNTKISILCDTAKGLAYLHGHKPAVIHRDLTAKNVLLSSDRVAKISDFGNARVIDIDPKCASELTSTTRVPGTIIYMPPEASSDHAKFNEKLDIFSYGQLSLFTATQTLPSRLLPVYDDENSCFRTEVQRRSKYIGQLEEKLGDHSLVKIIKECLANSPKVRPTAQNIVCCLEKL